MLPFWYSKDEPGTVVHVSGTVFVVLNEDWADDDDNPMESPRKKHPLSDDVWVLPLNFDPICIKN